MSHAAYPTGTDLTDYLTDQGVNASGVSASRATQAIGAAIAEFERAVDRKMLADATPQARTFTPPATLDGLLFLPDFIAVDSINYQPQGSTAEALVSLTDYFLQPVEALQDDLHYQPYTAVAFARRWPQPMYPALHNSLTITARWGYAAELPDDVWEAMLARGARRLLGPLALTLTGGKVSWTEAGVSETYGKDGQYGGLFAMLDDTYNAAVMHYRRWTL